MSLTIVGKDMEGGNDLPLTALNRNPVTTWREAVQRAGLATVILRPAPRNNQSRMLWESRCRVPRTEFVLHTIPGDRLHAGTG